MAEMPCTICRITPDGTVTTVAGTAAQTGIRPGSLPGNLCTASGMAFTGRNTLTISAGGALLNIVLP
ncbi:MAG TPA: hypothetical protein VEC01_04270 [Noviherbaspirillum sp.]|uniref:hypothetical protein n=1 Tax=Noviherbaspirillum sp. TaxID=1926288 RepID=UPI002D303240|nr:hypothetical protein [Noviherbaspirillum sp.]HYD94518.1 hypothetical protein [Noviherbaspirillum sp.]